MANGKRRPADLEKLIAQFEDPDPEVRIGAAEAVGRLGPAAVPPLLEALENVNSIVRGSAAWSLYRIGKGAKPAVPKLLDLVLDEDPEVRRVSHAALVSILSGNARLIPELELQVVLAHIRSLEDANDRVRTIAASALCSICNRIKKGTLPFAESVLIKIRESLINGLDKSDPQVRYHCVWALDYLGDSSPLVMEKLRNLLIDQTPRVRHRATVSIISLDPTFPLEVESLIECLSADEQDIVIKAIGGLENLGVKANSAVTALERLAGSSDNAVISMIAKRAIGRIVTGG